MFSGKTNLSIKSTLTLLALGLSTIAHASLVIGINDYPIALGGDADYQDLVVSVSGASLTSTTGSWQPMPQPNESGTPYWSGLSGDGPQMNIGYWVTGTGGFSGSQSTPDWSVANTDWYGNANGTGVPLLFSGTAVTVTVDAAVSALSAVNILGYSYLTDLNVVYPLLTGGQAGNTVTFYPTQPFEFDIELGPGAAIYGSDTTGEQHPDCARSKMPLPNGSKTTSRPTFSLRSSASITKPSTPTASEFTTAGTYPSQG